jgi:hypothetical protein
VWIAGGRGPPAEELLFMLEYRHRYLAQEDDTDKSLLRLAFARFTGSLRLDHRIRVRSGTGGIGDA